MSATTAKTDVLTELKDQHLTKVIGCKPKVFDLDRWEDEASFMVTAIKIGAIPEGMDHAHAAVIIPVEEYCLMIDKKDFIYIPSADLGAYLTLHGDETDNNISKLISTVFCISDSLNYCIQY
jgi:hypothetical protein